MRYQHSYAHGHTTPSFPSVVWSGSVALVLRTWRWSLRSSLSRWLLVSAIVLIGIAYVVTMSNVSTKGYELKAVERQVSSLRDETHRMEIKIAELGSLVQVQTRVGQFGMVPVDAIQFVSTLVKNAVATR